MKKKLSAACLAVLLVLELVLGNGVVGLPAEAGTGNEAVRVRVNGRWYGLYLGETKGTDGGWVYVPASMDALDGLGEGNVCQVSVSSNVENQGNMDVSGVDLYATAVSGGQESFLTGDRYCDGGWNPYGDRNVNVRLEGWNGHEWTDLNRAKPEYRTDMTTVLGYFASDTTWYNACRNITLGSLEGITALRVGLQLHVGGETGSLADYQEDAFGTFLGQPDLTVHGFCPEHPDSCLEPDCPRNTCRDLHHCSLCPECGRCLDGADCGCSHDKCEVSGETAVRVRVNGAWYGLNVAETAGKDGAKWVYVPVDIRSLRQNETNYLQLSSNVTSRSDHGRHSLDVYFTAGGGGDSFVTGDRYCDGGFRPYEDRRINMRLEFYDGSRWIPAVEEDCEEDFHSAVGYFAPEDAWYNYGRNVELGGVESYQAARVAVEISVGKGAEITGDYSQESFGEFLSPSTALETPAAGPELPLHRTTPPTVAGSSGRIGRAGTKLTVRVNGTWYGTDLEAVRTGTGGTAWVPVEIPLSALRENGENQFVLSGNVKNGTAMSEGSVDVFATRVRSGGSFQNVNDYYDDWALKDGSEWNMILEASEDGTSWTSLSGSAPCYYDTSMVLGKTADGRGSYGARNLHLGELSEYTYARVRIQLHVGEKLEADDAGEEPGGEPGEVPGGNMGEEGNVSHVTQAPAPGEAVSKGKNAEEAVLKVRVNGTWQAVSLAPYLGKTGWVTCPVDVAMLNGNAENYFSLSSNVISQGNYTDSSLDFFSTRTDKDLNSFLSGDPYCDSEFEGFADRNVNVKLELYDGKDWVRIPQEDHFYDEHCVLGQFGDTGEHYNIARNLTVGEMSGYRSARLSVLLHVGNALTVEEPYEASLAEEVVHRTAPSEPGAAVGRAGGGEPFLYVRVNGTWKSVSLKDQLGGNGIWVDCPVDLGLLKENQENHLNFTTNVISAGSFTDSSVDFYGTRTGRDLNSFFCRDRYCDNGYETYGDRNLNVKLELYNGEEWVSFPQGEVCFYDTTEPLGYLADDAEWHNMARNLMLGDLSGYESARVRAMLHVGASLKVQDMEPDNGGEETPIRHRVAPPEEKPGESVRDSADAALKVRVNGTWFETKLEEYKGSAAVWVPVPVDIGLLREGEENYFSFSTNVSNCGAHSGSSVDLYYSLAKSAAGSFICSDEFCDQDYVPCGDWNFNMRLELFDGESWVTAAPAEETYYDGSVVLGYDKEAGGWSNAARNLMIGSLDGCREARVLVELHVGSTLECLSEGETAEYGTGGFNRDVDVGRPAHEKMTDEAVPLSEEAEENGKKGFGVAALAVMTAASGAAGGLLWLKKRKVRR